MAKLSQTFTTNPLAPNYTPHFKNHHLKNCINNVPYTLSRRICSKVAPKTFDTLALKNKRNYPPERISHNTNK